jgi:hypothetical protein
MEKLPEIWPVHYRGICDIRAKFPAQHAVMFHAWLRRVHKRDAVVDAALFQ